MTRLAQTLDRRLRQWPARTARRVEKLVANIIVSADRESASLKIEESDGKAGTDPFFSDGHFFAGNGPNDVAANHDDYLYGKRT
jgi:hypothetical protein